MKIYLKYAQISFHNIFMVIRLKPCQMLITKTGWKLLEVHCTCTHHWDYDRMMFVENKK